MNTGSAALRRIVIALDAAEGSEFALELAHHLSGAVTTELSSLFVENVRLLEHAKSRLAREVTALGTERPLERIALERQMRAQSMQAKARIEQAAQRLGLRPSFQVMRGELVTELLRQAAEAEVLVLSLTQHAAGGGVELGEGIERLFEAGLPVMLLARKKLVSGHSIAVVVEDPAHVNAPLQAAARLAKRTGSRLTVLLAGRALAEPDESLARLTEILARNDAAVGEIIPIRRLSAAAIERTVRLCRAWLLVVSGDAPPAAVRPATELLQKLPGALMLVRG